MKINRNILSRGALVMSLPFLMTACNNEKKTGASSAEIRKVETKIDSVQNLRDGAQARLDSCIGRADVALHTHNQCADSLYGDYQQFIDSKYLLSKYFSPADLDIIRDTADNWLPATAQDTDEYKRLAIERATLLDVQKLFATYVDDNGIDPCRKELMMILEFHQKADGTYDTKFVDDNINTLCIRQMADRANFAAYRDSRNALSSSVRSIADSASVIRAQVAEYDVRLKQLKDSLAIVRGKAGRRVR